MPGFISYSADNDRAFKNQLDRAFAVVDDLTEPFKLIAADFYRSEKAIFKLSGPGQYEDFKRDKKGKSYYKDRKQAKYGSAYPLLRATGKLERSVTSGNDSNAILIIGKNVLAIGTSVAYGIYHQSDEPRSKMPLRKFLFIGPESQFAVGDQAGRLSRWNNIINTFILRKMQVAFKAAT